MRVTRQTICFSLAFALLVTSAATNSQPLLGQEAREFEVLTGREVSGSGTRSFAPTTSPGNQLEGVSVRRRVRTRPVSHPNVAQLPSSSTYVPRHQRIVGAREIGDTSIIETVPGKTVYQEVGGVMPMSEPCMDGSCGHGHGAIGCDSCGDTGCGDCIRCPKLSCKNMQFIIGAQGVQSPRDMFTNNNGSVPHSSFGFHGGVNWGFHFPCVTPEIAFQLGALFTSSNYNGELLTYDKRNQTFITGGFYRRVDWGLQGGLVVDYVNDDWYVNHELIQLRGEISWVFQNCFEFGFNFAGSTRTSQSMAEYNAFAPDAQFLETREALDNYRFFARQRFKRGGEGRIFAGWTEDGDGLLGADFTLPISCDWGVQGGFTYVAPKADGVQDPTFNDPWNYDHDNELWNVSVSLVWYPGGFDNVFCKYNRPLFNVADNGSFLQKISQE